MQKAKYTVRYDKCTSTSEQEVTNRLNGYKTNDDVRHSLTDWLTEYTCYRLADKFSIKGHHDLSKALVEHTKEFLKSARPLGEPDTNVRAN